MDLTSERWARIREVFDEAVAVPRDEVEDWVSVRCDGDAKAVEEVRKLLAGHWRTTSILGCIAQELIPAEDSDLIGVRIGAYELLEQIGYGGMGAVYRAGRADDAYRKLVAVKLLGFRCAGPDVESAFRKERQILATLEHPNIARLLDGGSTPEGLLYLVMELVEGERIDDYCSRRRLDLESRLRIFDDVCSAVAHAHRNLVVHRDIKPANIAVTADGSPKLLDFGIARVISEAGPHDPTLGGRMTPQYASPEQIKGEPVGTASDIYSLGLVLYELVTGGVRPYQAGADNLREATSAICELEPPRPSEVSRTSFRKSLRGDLDNLVLKTLAKDPARRYRSVDELQEDIRRTGYALDSGNPYRL
jgi:serine/threonine protein kinase